MSRAAYPNNNQTQAQPDSGTLLCNVHIVSPQGIIPGGWLLLQDGCIAALGTAEDALPEAGHCIEGQGGLVLPGFIDIHVHGGAGRDFMEADEAGLDAITGFHAGHGTTAMLATTLTASRAELTGVLKQVSRYMQRPMPYARLLGVHLEGPFINIRHKGAQNPEHIITPQTEWLDEWAEAYPGLIKIHTLAPEVAGAPPYIARLAAHGIIPALGHSDASFAEVSHAADQGLCHAVHTFNAMRPFHHREPGAAGAVLTDDRITAEVIADGHHAHPAAIKLLVRSKGPDRVLLITDAMAAAGLGPGDYELGGLPVVVQDGIARLRGTDSLAGSTLTMAQAFRFMVREVGVPVEQASRMASLNPARRLGISAMTGTLESGKRADVLLMDAQLNVSRVWIGGRELTKK
ncbi:N-acetylglucosamine-6-phosphate deacetylase [Paenibacillus sp. y28]|uniref:N-acetylglucosamine-6-phosphate deacetylase n=1 Tax=Paenibacillus sp. y28 TaxID=3129110 RepID=UPI003018C0C7